MHGYILYVGMQSIFSFFFGKAVANANGTPTIRFLMDLITSYGVLKYFYSDKGTHFKNKKVDYECKKLGITHIFSSVITN